MSKFVNIGGHDNDPTYRYKMPALVIKPEGKGRVAIVNINEVSKALKCEPSWPTQFFSLELGTIVKYDKIKNKTMINGAPSCDALAYLLDKFISLFILCPSCKLPEISLEVHKRDIKVDCAACGYNSSLETEHKLRSFILKNPPIVKARKIVEKVPVCEPTDLKEEVPWASDLRPEAVAQRRREEMMRVDPRAAIALLLKEDKTRDEIVRELSIFLDRPGSLLLETLAEDSTPDEFIEQCGKYAEVLLIFFPNVSAQKTLLATLEKIFQEKPDFAVRAIAISMAFYFTFAIVDERTFLQWKIDNLAVKKFQHWLRTADEE